MADIVEVGRLEGTRFRLSAMLDAKGGGGDWKCATNGGA